MFQDPVLVLKIIGAVAAFAIGLWVGFGMPGVGRPRESREWRSSDRLSATWINRVFFTGTRAPRRFDGSRLVAPGPRSQPEADAEDEEERAEVIRLRRPGR